MELVKEILITAGGTAVIIVSAIGLSIKFIVASLMKGYEERLNEKLEIQKSKLRKKEYVSKTRFDTELLIYRELSKAFFGAVRAVHQIVPCGEIRMPPEGEKADCRENRLNQAFDATVSAQNALNENAPFIQPRFYDKYDEVLEDIKKQIRFASENRQMAIENIPKEASDRTSTLTEKLKELNGEIHTHLDSLEVI